LCWRRRIQTNIIEVHRPRTTSLRVVLIAETKGNRIDIGQVHALVSKGLQVDIPFGPLTYLCCIRIIVIDYSGTIERMPL
jgi:hypothetical protein